MWGIGLVLDASDVPMFNTAAVALRTGVPAATFRAWERRYRFPAPHRDEQRVRLYSERDIAAITWLDGQTALGVSISRAVNILRQGYVQPLRRIAANGHANPSGRTFAALQGELTSLLLQFDQDGAELVLREAFGLYNLEDVCLHLLQPALIDIGERWHAGEVGVAEEHFATSLLRTRLFALLAMFGSGGHGNAIFAACPEGEWHEVGLLMVCVLLSRRGYAVRYLGPSLPAGEVIEPVRRFHPSLLIFSAQNRETGLEVTRIHRLLQTELTAQPVFAFGGQAFNTDVELRGATPGTYLGENAGQAVTRVQELLGQRAAAF